MARSKKTEKMDAEQLLDILGSYRRQIIRSGKETSTACLSDIFSSLNFVLEKNGYKGYYSGDNTIESY